MPSLFSAWFGSRVPSGEDINETASEPDGILVLEDPPVARVDICFVHGLTGDRMDTWTAPGRSEPWSTALLPARLPHARILTFGYDAYYVNAFATTSKNRLLDHAKNLLYDLQANREACNASSRPLIFVAHSMGGLVCKQAILQSRHNPESRLCDIFDSLRGIAFMGTPHRGSWMAKWAVTPISAIGIVKSTNVSLLEVLETNSQALELIQDGFISMIRQQSEMGRKIQLICFYEEMDTLLVGQVVPKESAIFEGYEYISIRENHANMAKFASASSNGFKRLASALCRWERENNDHQVVPSSQLSQETPLTSLTKDNENAETTPTSQYTFTLSKDNKAALQHLRAVNPEDLARKIENMKGPLLPKVSEWILATADFLSFMGCPEGRENSPTSCRLLWLTGPPGTGKTMLVLGLIHHVRRQVSTQIPIPSLSYFFCQRANRDMSDPTTVLRSLIWMLLNQQSHLICHLRAKYDTSGSILFTDELAFYALADIFRAMLQDPALQEAYFVIDALDECRKPAALQLYQLIEESLTLNEKVKWLISSRPDVDIQAKFDETGDNPVPKSLVSVGNQEAEAAIKQYISEKLSLLQRRPGYNHEVITRVATTVQNQPDKTLAWLSLAFRELDHVDGCRATEKLKNICSFQKIGGPAAASSISQPAFEAAKKSFRADLDDEALFKTILTIKTIEPIWQVVETLQQTQKLRDLGRIRQFLERLESFATALSVGVTPDILTLIWGPVRVLLKLSSPTAEPFEKLVKSFVRLGETLPPFAVLEDTVGENEKTRELLLLFYKDILQFYLITLKFFRLRSSRVFFESLWPQQARKASLVLDHIERHASLIDPNVTLAQIQEQQSVRMHSIHTFDHNSSSQCRQDFHALRARISPHAYDEILDRAQDRLCQGTAKWLFKDEFFVRWQDVADHSTPLLWLNGNPGSGKTFMAAAVAAEVKSRHCCLHIFASHEYRTRTTAKSILQSLIFQAALTNEALQLILVEMDERELMGGTKANATLLQKMMQSFAPFYIIIDGLDEIDELERDILLQYLLDLPRSCKKLKILLSSRPADDIKNRLTGKANEIIIHKRNASSIQAYVNKRTPGLLQNFAGESDAKAEIQRLLLRLAAESEGMFLYARIVIDNLRMLCSLLEVRQYLEDLPSTLDEVYHRVIQRINDWGERERRKARRIIGWVGCTPAPMTTLEIEQALFIATEGSVVRSTGHLNFVRLCGPIVEVTDDCLRFVHFTFKEYIFSPKTDCYIKIMDVNRDLAITCLHYLCSELFDIGISDRDIEKNILSGKYRFQAYAVTFWITLIMQLGLKKETLETCEEVMTKLQQLADVRQNVDFKSSPETCLAFSNTMESKWPQVYELLKKTLQFREDKRWTDWNFLNDARWTNFDPLTLSQMTSRIHHHFEYLLHAWREEKEDRERLLNVMTTQYGPKVFKCQFPSCHLNRLGFSYAKNRLNHIQNHSRPWKCAMPNCEFATIGFNSQSALSQHLSKCRRMADSSPSTVTEVEVEELQVLLFESIRQGNVRQLRQLLRHPKLRKIRPPASLLDLYGPGISWRDWLRTELAIFAAQLGSVTMVEEVTSYFAQLQDISSTKQLDDRIAFAAVKSENLDLFEWLLRHTAYMEKQDNYKLESEEVKYKLVQSSWYPYMATLVLQTEADEIYARWENYLFTPEFDAETRQDYYERDPLACLLPEHQKTAVIFSRPCFNAIKGNKAWEVRLIKTWRRFANQGILNPGILGHTLRNVVKSSFSVTLGEELLRLGASVNFPEKGIVFPGRRGKKRANGMTILHTAAKSTTFAAAKFMQFLIENGADPSRTWAARDIRYEIGPRMLEKHLGITWDELIERGPRHRRTEAPAADYGAIL